MFKKPSRTTRSVTSSPTADDTSKPDPVRHNQVKEHKRSVLTPAIAVSGDISGEEDLVLDGRMDGSVNLPGNEVLIGPEGRIQADLIALKVSVEGWLKGNIKSSERVIIKHSGRVEGNIVAPRVVLEDGCQFKGSVEMNIDPKASLSENKPQDPKPKVGPQDPKVDQYGPQNKSRASGAS